jgi:AcrR family transcriptional regulator
VQTKKRQSRGIKRIEQILSAAAQEFDAVGYEAATTNGIAARAGISPGSLYQFFENKATIAEALAVRYAAELQATHEFALDPDAASSLSLDAWLDRVVDPLVAFYVSNPTFKTLMYAADVSPALAESTQSLQDAVLERVDAVIAARAPSLSKRDRARAANVSMQIFKSLMPMVLGAKPSERAAIVRELKSALSGYLGRLG